MEIRYPKNVKDVMPVAILAMEFYQINVLLVIVTDTISKLNAS